MLASARMKMHDRAVDHVTLASEVCEHFEVLLISPFHAVRVGMRIRGPEVYDVSLLR